MAIYTAKGADAHRLWNRDKGTYLYTVNLSSALVVGDIIVFIDGIWYGKRVADYEIGFEDLDSNASPTIAFSLGALNNGFPGNPTALDANTFSTWETGITTARTGGMFRPTTANHMLCYRPDKAIGLVVTTAAATWGGNGKTITLSLTFAPF